MSGAGRSTSRASRDDAQRPAGAAPSADQLVGVAATLMRGAAAQDGAGARRGYADQALEQLAETLGKKVVDPDS